MQYTFNLGMEESILSAQRELERLAPAVDSEGKESSKKAADYLEEGVSTLKTHQKHIKVADCSDYGWGVVYQANPLADDSDNEKQLCRADKKQRKTMKKEKNLEEEAGAAEGVDSLTLITTGSIL